MYSFEGDFRRKPQQNLAGASAQRKTDRDALILQSQLQRQKREVKILLIIFCSYQKTYRPCCLYTIISIIDHSGILINISD